MWRHRFMSATYALAFLFNDRFKAEYVEWDNATLQVIVSGGIYVIWFLMAFESHLQDNGLSPIRTVRSRFLFAASLGGLLAFALIAVIVSYPVLKLFLPKVTNGTYAPDVATFCVFAIFLAALSYFGSALASILAFGRVRLNDAMELGRQNFRFSFARLLSLGILIFLLTFGIIFPLRDSVAGGLEPIGSSHSLDGTYVEALNFISCLTDVFFQCAAAIVLSRIFLDQKVHASSR
jgi:hypothetical protein